MLSNLVASLSALALLESASARPVPYYWKAQRGAAKREVPQEHSHEDIITVVRASLNTNNPDKIQDPVFALLGDAAAITGAGDIKDPECLQQATADQAFTNAKSAKDVAGMVAALQFRALERNTGSVGLQSNQCTSITAKNPEIAAIKQHQDAASKGAAATNKAIVLELAKQIASVGGDPVKALRTGTFAPGQVGDPTGAGNTCDDANDPVGCIFTQKLLVKDATEAEVQAAAKGAASSSAGSASGSASASSGDDGDDCSDEGDGAAAASGSGAAASGAAAKLNFGSCPAPEIIGAVGLDGRTEFAFEPKNLQAYAHSSADNIGIITDFMCDNLVNECGLQQGDATVNFCNQAEAQVGQGTGDGALADKWNALFGITTNFANAKGSSSASASASSGAAASSGSASSGAAASSALDFGTCTNPTIEFGGSFDGRTEQAFAPENPDSFNHGSADGIAVLTSFICQQLSDSCGASAATVSKCNAGATQANALTGGKAADTFNAALGFTTDFAANPITDGKILGANGATASGSGAAAASSSPAPASPTTTASSSSSTGGSSSSSGAASGGNFQVFTGTLGGIAATPVTSSGDSTRPFEVEGDTFVGIAAALQRSCSIQNNACADAANSGAAFSVSDCNAQEEKCNAADASVQGRF